MAAAYPRLRAGARGALALVFGVLGIVIGGIEAAYYGPKVGLSGDDYTGLLALAGGVVLLGVGAVTLYNVEATVHPMPGMDVGLLGMSFLNRMEMRREGESLTLTKRY